MPYRRTGAISLRQISLSPEDVQDLRNIQPFVLTTPEIPNYDIAYLGKEKIDDIGCYTFSVKPKKMLPGKRYFEGMASKEIANALGLSEARISQVHSRATTLLRAILESEAADLVLAA